MEAGSCQFLKTAKQLPLLCVRTFHPSFASHAIHTKFSSAIKYWTTTATLDRSWWDVRRRLLWSMCIPSLTFVCQMFRTWNTIWRMGRGKVSKWPSAVQSSTGSSTLFALTTFGQAFASVDLPPVWGENMGGCYCRGALKPFLLCWRRRSAEYRQVMAKWCRGRAWSSHRRCLGSSSMAQSLFWQYLMHGCPSAYRSQGWNVTVTSLHTSRGLHPFLCTEAGEQPCQSELLDAAYDFGVTRDLYDDHRWHFFYWFGIVSRDKHRNGAWFFHVGWCGL